MFNLIYKYCNNTAMLQEYNRAKENGYAGEYSNCLVYFSTLYRKMDSLHGVWWLHHQVPTISEPNWNNFYPGQIVMSGERYYPTDGRCISVISSEMYQLFGNIPASAETILPVIAMYWQCKKRKEWCFQCTTAGTSGHSEPAWVETAGAEITDNSVTWEAVLFDSLKTSYESVSLSLNYIDRSRNSEVLVNCEYQQDGDFNYDPDTRILTFNKYVDENLPVIIRTPMPARWIIDDILQKVVDKLPDTLPMEYFQSNLVFTDWLIWNEININKTAPISAINQIVEAIPGEWLIEPTDDDNIRFSVYPKILADELPEVGSFVINEFFFRDNPVLDSSSVERFNTINVMKHATIRNAYVEVTTNE